MHLDLYDQDSKGLVTSPFKFLHRFFKIYVSGFRGASELSNQLMNRVNRGKRALLDDFELKSVDTGM
ncbi:hypothetical protein [Halalkalibacter okhensis]|uniref:Uncharacterized protein n=1 Tax=Halalkalibacter okhensis TaxID=333138 RepID=A0A0B0IN94_9BACI|nr:hypothetical protein LQ50_02150 [Halalkalibacter okhensis]